MPVLLLAAIGAGGYLLYRTLRNSARTAQNQRHPAKQERVKVELDIRPIGLSRLPKEIRSPYGIMLSKNQLEDLAAKFSEKTQGSEQYPTCQNCPFQKFYFLLLECRGRRVLAPHVATCQDPAAKSTWERIWASKSIIKELGGTEKADEAVTLLKAILLCPEDAAHNTAEIISPSLNPKVRDEIEEVIGRVLDEETES